MKRFVLILLVVIVVVVAALTVSVAMRPEFVAAPVVESQAPTQTIEEYIRANIGTLSPEPPTLGGTFSVTNVSAATGVGSVSYEDGHMAYTADFLYTINADGSLKVQGFKIREEE